MTDSFDNPRFLQACRREPLDRPPVWIMRQAGRYMPEYQALRAGRTFLEFCKTPDLCTQATLLPIDILGVDAAIIFADILPILEGMGAELDYLEGRGPVLSNPVRRTSDVERIRVCHPLESTGYVMDAIEQVKGELGNRLPLIGFAGAPFTLAAYLIEGQGSKNFRKVKQLMYTEPAVFEMLLEKLAQTVGPYLAAQVEAGADAIQLFDSWAGCLGPAEYARFAARYSRRALEEVTGTVPTIMYVNGAGTLLDEMLAVGTDVIGIDWRIELDQVRAQIGGNVALQGNLDPSVLYAPPDVVRREVQRVIRTHGPEPGHIVNLGSGILPDIPVDHAKAMVETVQAHSWEEARA